MTNKKSIASLNKTLRIAEAARLLGVTPTTLRRWEQSDYLKPLRIGPRRDRRYIKDEILKLMKK